MAAQITGGVDTHLDVHGVAALDGLGALVGVESFPTTTEGNRALLGWLGSHGEVVVVGVEGTGSYGAGLARHLQREGVAVLEVDRPNRQRRRRQGKTDPHDTVTAARATQARRLPSSTSAYAWTPRHRLQRRAQRRLRGRPLPPQRREPTAPRVRRVLR
jgi:transposase